MSNADMTPRLQSTYRTLPIRYTVQSKTPATIQELYKIVSETELPSILVFAKSTLSQWLSAAQSLSEGSVSMRLDLESLQQRYETLLSQAQTLRKPSMLLFSELQSIKTELIVILKVGMLVENAGGNLNWLDQSQHYLPR